MLLISCSLTLSTDHDMRAVEEAPETHSTIQSPESARMQDEIDFLDAPPSLSNSPAQSSSSEPDPDIDPDESWISALVTPNTLPDRGLQTWIANPLIYMPFDYLKTLRNRLPAHKLEPNGALDMTQYPALFFYDMLQFPSTIGSLLEPACKAPPIGSRMTPGTLYGFQALVKGGTGEPLVRATGRDTDTVKGMVVFGRGRNNRTTLAEYYGEGFKRVKGKVRIVLNDGKKKDVEAYLWIWAGEQEEYLCIGGEAVAWSLEKYAGGEFH